MNSVRPAVSRELDWINAQYAEVGFQASEFENERILILESDGQKAALGRLTPVDANSAELGGILVLPAFRGKGFAEQIVSGLLEPPTTYQKIYCLPFLKLESFYKRFGFRDLTPEESEGLPFKIQKKSNWCKCTYQEKTLVLIRHQAL